MGVLAQPKSTRPKMDDSQYVVTVWRGGATWSMRAHATCSGVEDLENGRFPSTWLEKATPFYSAPFDVMHITRGSAPNKDVFFGTEQPCVN